MQHRLKRECGFIIRDSGVIGVPPVFEGAARINDDTALAARLHWHRRPRWGRSTPTPLPGTLSLQAHHLHWRRRHASDAVHVSLPRRRPHWGRSARASRASEQPPPSHHHAERAAPGALLPGILPLPPAHQRPGLRPQTFVSHCNPMVYKY